MNSKPEHAQQEEEEQAPHEKGGKCGPPGLVHFLGVVANEASGSQIGVLGPGGTWPINGG